RLPHRAGSPSNCRPTEAEGGTENAANAAGRGRMGGAAADARSRGAPLARSVSDAAGSMRSGGDDAQGGSPAARLGGGNRVEPSIARAGTARPATETAWFGAIRRGTGRSAEFRHGDGGAAVAFGAFHGRGCLADGSWANGFGGYHRGGNG